MIMGYLDTRCYDDYHGGCCYNGYHDRSCDDGYHERCCDNGHFEMSYRAVDSNHMEGHQKVDKVSFDNPDMMTIIPAWKYSKN